VVVELTVDTAIEHHRWRHPPAASLPVIKRWDVAESLTCPILSINNLW
jgi:hypothetical protein